MSVLALVAHATFPRSTGLIVNMMPFIMGDVASLPPEHQGYQPLIDACDIEPSEHGKVGYLSIMETTISEERSQRRGGIHIERHPALSWGGGGWGGGESPKPTKPKRAQGLYMGSTVDASCRAWDHRVEVPGPMGDCSHLANTITQAPVALFNAGEVYWMTDRCPHESLPIRAGTHRQWFRVVTSPVDLWYSRHSTANRLGVQPACRIETRDKFALAA